MFGDEIPRGSSARTVGLMKLQQTVYPVYLIGVTDVMLDTYRFLERNGVKVAGCFVTDFSWQPGLRVGNMPVERMTDVLNKNDKIVVGLAMGIAHSRARTKNMLLKTGKVEDCFFFDVPAFGEIDGDLVHEHAAEFDNLHERLTDDLSRQVLEAFVKSRVENDPAAVNDKIVPGEDQYFSDVVGLSRDEAFVDCGAFTGDTFHCFLKHANGQYRAYYAFECDTVNFDILEANVRGFHDVSLFKKGVSDKPGFAYMENAGMASSYVSPSGSGEGIILDTIDNVLAGKSCSFIKMDIEGCELAALRGAENTIRSQKPKLAVCVYHKPLDLLQIPQYILSLNAGYSLYLRKYQDCFSDELVLYAVP
jgi:FkbM family methyltransferase